MKNKLEKNENHGKVFLKTIEMAYISSAITISVISYAEILDFSLLLIFQNLILSHLILFQVFEISASATFYL